LQERQVLKRIEKKKERQALKERIMNDIDPWGWSDSGASSTYVNDDDEKHTEATRLASNKTVGLPTGDKVTAREQRKLKNGLRHPANTADTIPGLKTTLVSTGKSVDANYVMVYDKEEVNVYDAETTTIIATEEAVMTGY
jgi:DNA topoisomerase VI subunit A